MEISGFPEGVRVSKGGCTCKPGGCTGIGSLHICDETLTKIEFLAAFHGFKETTLCSA